MGLNLMEGNFSNLKGHFEDWEAVKVNDAILSTCSTSWMDIGQVNIEPDENSKLQLRSYIARRDSNSKFWGVKDPRISLLLESWDKACDHEVNYIFIVRHWAACIDSLYRRASNRLLHGQHVLDHSLFWEKPCLAHRMWLNYNKKILDFYSLNKDRCILITQNYMTSNACHLPKILNDKFNLALDISLESPIKRDLLTEKAEKIIQENASSYMIECLENLWNEILSSTNLKSENENIIWSSTLTDEEALTIKKLSQKKICSPMMVPTAFEAVNLAHPKSVESKPEEEMMPWQAIIDLGITAKSKGNFFDAERFFLKAISLGSFPYAYVYVGDIYEEQGKLLEAERYYGIAILKNPQNPAFKIRLANLLRRLGQHQRAALTYKDAFDIEFPSAALVCHAADSVLKSEGPESAISFLNGFTSFSKENSVSSTLARLEALIDTKRAEQTFKNIAREQLSTINISSQIAKVMSSISDSGSEMCFLTYSLKQLRRYFSLIEIDKILQEQEI
ncbi:hypothetical protein WH50_07155 [Pokkaliibacter plantistimulans]|uniref:Tetratricopeptide repeat protein n=2 Tax=Pokkaliibacter plantistimulans TaxID=1635171 RepID=A0ABX5LZ61_9GAMM|nr:hypothetical protein WH50_07155 [Pokkaliibacter plantistimulans]